MSKGVAGIYLENLAMKLFKLNATPHCTYSEKSICCSYFEKYKVNYLHKVLS